MLCERAQELFSDYYEGAVKPAMLVPLEGHIDECEDCRGKLHGMRDVWIILDTAPHVAPPKDFRATVWSRIDAMEAQKAQTRRPSFAFDWRSLFRPATLGWAAAVLALIILAPVVIPGGHTVARMWFPWNVFMSAPPASQVSLGQPQVTIKDGEKWVDLEVKNSSTSSKQIEVKLEGSTAGTVVIEAPAGSKATYHIAPSPGNSIRLQAQWQENGAQMSESRSTGQ
jgi:hypothetical protein